MEFVETIRLEDGRFHLLPLHQERLTRTISEVYGDSCRIPDLKMALREIKGVPTEGLYKCRVVYDRQIKSIELQPYSPRCLKTLKMVEAPDDLDYHLKSTDRSRLTALVRQKEECDEVLIIRRGLLTDTSYTNLLFQASDRIYTPPHPLLKGVMRQSLLEAGLIEELDLTPDDIAPGNRLGITHAILINAMMPLARGPRIPIGRINSQKLS